MKTISTVVLLATGTVLASGCGSHAANQAAAAAPATTAASCHDQYQDWKNGPAHAEVKKLVAALKSVQSAGAAEDISLTESGLKRVGKVAHQLQSYPIPACADPAGDWGKVLARLRAAGDNVGSMSGLLGLVAAEEPLKKVKPLLGKLGAEVKHSTGQSAPTS